MKALCNGHSLAGKNPRAAPVVKCEPAKGLSEAVGSLSFGLRGRGLAAMMPVYLKAVVEVESAERQAEQHIARLGWDRMDEEPEDDEASTHLHDWRHCVGTRGEYPAAVEHRPKAR